ncbi:MAG TPA: MotA/TolQ/ExbB proton channel family protein [Gemmataceae bacterium]|jgi:biopolymer transport protein ExbB|nr:MotA/TolQ/ExbB proton channel family protein [Gemmataceae bacterium]
MLRFPARLQATRAGLVFAIILGLWLTGLAWLSLGSSTAHANQDDQPAADASQEGAKPEAAPRPNLIRHILASAGLFFGPLLFLVSVGLVAIIVLLSLDLRLGVAIPPKFVEDFTNTVNQRHFREAFELAKAEPSFLGKVLTAGMGRLQYGIEDSREVAYHTIESIKASKENLITYLATIGSLGPMLGLVGTVYGMILSFMELSQPGHTPNPQRLADGISHALVITLLGVALAVPAIFCHALFRNRLIRLSMDTSNVADDLLTQMYHNSRKQAAAGTTPAMTEESLGQ